MVTSTPRRAAREALIMVGGRLMNALGILERAGIDHDVRDEIASQFTAINALIETLSQRADDEGEAI